MGAAARTGVLAVGQRKDLFSFPLKQFKTWFCFHLLPFVSGCDDTDRGILQKTVCERHEDGQHADDDEQNPDPAGTEVHDVCDESDDHQHQTRIHYIASHGYDKRPIVVWSELAADSVESRRRMTKNSATTRMAATATRIARRILPARPVRRPRIAKMTQITAIVESMNPPKEIGKAEFQVKL